MMMGGLYTYVITSIAHLHRLSAPRLLQGTIENSASPDRALCRCRVTVSIGIQPSTGLKLFFVFDAWGNFKTLSLGNSTLLV